MSKKKLKLCPFCESNDADFGNHPEQCFLYRIKKQASTDCMAYFKEDCEEAWQRRPIETRIQSKLQALEAENKDLIAEADIAHKKDLQWEKINKAALADNEKLKKWLNEFRDNAEQLENKLSLLMGELVGKGRKVDDLQAQLNKVKRISNSCVPCSAIDGDCCGVIYWTDEGKFLCNECGREFNIDRWIPVTAETLPKIPDSDLINSEFVWICDMNSKCFECSYYNYELKAWQGDLKNPTHLKPIILPESEVKK